MTIVPLDNKLPLVTVSSFFYIYHPNTSKRPYTPIKITENELVFAIKVYPKGLLSQYIYSLNIGDSIFLSENIPKKVYVQNEHKDILLIAGGTGISPMLQILNENDKFVLIFCNLTLDDIFLSEEINKYKNVKVFHVIENLQENLKNHYKGRINRTIVEDVIKLENEILCDFVYVCGPPLFMECVCGGKNGSEQGDFKGILKEVGFKKSQVYKF